MKNLLPLSLAVAAPLLFSQSAFAEFDYFKTDGSFKRFSVSAGWLHAAPQGDANPLQNTTAIKSGEVVNNGSVKADTVLDVIVEDQDGYELVKPLLQGLGSTDLDSLGLSGKSQINGLDSFASAAGTGLVADDADTVGLLFNYHIDDNWSVELKAGVPPKVDILGKGKVVAPLTGTAQTAVGDFAIKKDIDITNLEKDGGVASTARAWLPAAEVHYQFGKSGVNKFRPYVGAGVIYAYFNDIELNPGIRSDLEKAGDQIQNIKLGQAGAALENVPSGKKMTVDVEADSAFAPIFTVGATYDFNDRWFGVGSVSYAKLSSDTTISVKNDSGDELIRAVDTLDIDPVISYLGVGYRF